MMNFTIQKPRAATLLNLLKSASAARKPLPNYLPIDIRHHIGQPRLRLVSTCCIPRKQHRNLSRPLPPSRRYLHEFSKIPLHMDAQNPVLIAGAGPTGLMAALWLARLGTPFRIIDKHAFAASTSRAAVVHARTLEYYRMLGLSERALAEGRIVRNMAFFGNLKEIVRREFNEIGRGKSKFPFVLMYPQDLNERMMSEELEKMGVNIEREVELTDLEQNDEYATVTLKNKEGIEERFRASYVLGCDGGHSAVRAHTNIKSTPGAYSQRFFVADVEGEVSVGLENVNICFNSDDFCLLFAMPNGRIRLAGWAPEESISREFSFSDVAESVKRNTGATVRKVHWFSTYTVYHGVAETFRDRRVFICGDAAHVHSPVGGQGMNTGLGDASNISWKLAAVLAGKANLDILDTYQPERRPFAERLVNTTDKSFSIATDRGFIGWVWRTMVMGNIAPLIFRLGLLDNTLFETVSQIRIEYRDSPISNGNRISGLYAGDRLPWISFENGVDNFDQLGALNWQIHVYGNLDGNIRALGQEKNIHIHNFPFNEDVKAKGIPKDAAILLRPDGHIGQLFEGSSDDQINQIRNFLDRWGIGSF
ncbi:hypothetical protein TWF730_004904 [Orbilia blumenaviensis]|uniref:FAD-binding domain-containing protein n=1 Tax=Orbilia blumenaviensis TaxID=1796055 RepID=A0AAV9VMU9_9PEZI